MTQRTNNVTRPQDQLRDPGWLMRSLGGRWIRKDERIAVLKLPWCFPKSWIPAAVKRVEASYRLVYPDATPKLTTQGRLILIEWEASR